MNDLLGQDAEMALLRGLTRHIISKTFVDVGAERGAVASTLFSCGLSGVLFEPLPKHFDELNALVEANKSKVFPWAMAEADDTRKFFVATDLQGNELDHFQSLERIESDPRFQHGRTFDVVCRSIASLIDEGVLEANVGVLKTDTEGRDLSVLQGMGSMRPELVICEFFTAGLYAGWHNAEPELAIDHMRNIGYSRYVACKRVERFENCVMGPCDFLQSQWGNLFFFSDDLFTRAELTIAAFLGSRERNMVDYWTKIEDDRVAKESIISDLSVALAARLIAIETLDAEVTRLKSKYEPSDQAALNSH